MISRRQTVLCFLVLLAALAARLPAAKSGAESLLDAAIAYHDFSGVWRRGAWELEIAESRPDGSERTARIVVDQPGGAFRYSSSRQGRLLEGDLAGAWCRLRLDGSEDVSPEEAEGLGLTCARLQRLRDYYTYLWGLPMKLRDPGTILDPEVIATSFADRPALALRVTYEEEVGSDVWYLYFDPGSRALVGYRFYHDESAGDGEYIVLEGETAVAGLRLPRRRSWYTNAGDELLGTDTLVSLVRLD